MPQSIIPEERYPTKVSSDFATQAQAEKTVASLTRDSKFPRAQISVIEPHDDALPHKVEPETRAIGAKVATTHAAWVTAGLLAGLAVAWLLVNAGPALARANPLLTTMALALIFPMLGFFVASVISMRPDHDRVVYRARAAADTGRWTVVVHCANNEEKRRAKAAMDHTVQTL